MTIETSSPPQDASPILPAHMSDTIGVIAKLHADHERGATPIQRLIERSTEWLARPRFIGVFTLFVVAWLSIVRLQMKLHGSSFDPPPFNLLQGALTVLAVYMTALILSTQRRAAELAIHREQLTLELATLAELKSAKTIAMLEEIRRDNPQLPDRVDEEAAAMAESVDPEAVLQSITNSVEGRNTEPPTDATPRNQ